MAGVSIKLLKIRGAELGLGKAVFLLVVFFCLFLTIYKVWRPYLALKASQSGISEADLKSSPEWLALSDRRREIELDPLLSEADKQLLIHTWLQMAQEVRVWPGLLTSANLNPSFTSKMGLFLPAVLLGFGIFLTHGVGAFHRNSLSFPTPLSAPTFSGEVGGSPAESHPGGGADLAERVTALKARLQAQPDDLQGWVLLARSQANLADYAGSVLALRKALELTPGHPDILADLADMVAMSQGRKLQGEPEQLIAQALKADPAHEKALALAASVAEQAGDAGKAKVYWDLLSGVQQKKLVQAKGEPSAGFALPVSVAISDAAKKAMKPASVLFVYLKANPGPGMPLAVVRVPASEISAGKVLLTLNESSFIQPEGLSQLPAEVHVQSRLAIQGTAQTERGDWTSEWQAVSIGSASTGQTVELQLQAR